MKPIADSSKAHAFTLDLSERLVKRRCATFFMTVAGYSMEGFGIQGGELIVKRYDMLGKRRYLCSGNARYAPIPAADVECQVWGVVRSVIHEFPV